MTNRIPLLLAAALTCAVASAATRAAAAPGGEGRASPAGIAGGFACTVPDLVLTAGLDLDGTREELDRARADLVRYEACLDARGEAAEVLDPDAVGKLTLQRQAAASLRQLLDAFGEAVSEVRARSVPGS